MSRYPFKHSPRFRHGDSQALAEVGRQARNLRVAQEPSSVVNILDSARWRFVACVHLSLSSFCDHIHSLHSVALVYAVITPVARMFLSAQATSGRSESAFSLSSFQQWDRRGSVQPRLLNMLTTLAASQPKDKDGLRALVNQLAEHLFPPPKQATSTKDDRDSTQRRDERECQSRPAGDGSL